MVSMLGIVIGSAALIIVLSAFNGFEGLVKQLYSSFYPDIAITVIEGKTFQADSINLVEINAIKGVESVSLTLEENAIVVYDSEEHIAVLKGVDSFFAHVTAVDDSVIVGKYQLKKPLKDGAYLDQAVIGAGVANVLNVRLGPSALPLSVYMPRRSTSSGIASTQAFKKQRITPIGIFRIQQEFDSKFVVVPLDFMQKLLEFKKGEVGAVEIKLAKGADASKVQKKLQDLVGDRFVVKNRYQLNETIYRVMRTEKWAVYLVLTFIVIVAAFNMIGSISMLVIEKKTDIGVLRALGASRGLIQRIFLMEGLLQTLVSMAIGFSVALILLVGQILFGWLKIPGSGSFVVQSYPVDLQLSDFVLVAVTILVIGLAAAWLPSRRAASMEHLLRDE